MLPSSANYTIGIDARAATEVKAGRGRVVRELLRALDAGDSPHRYLCFAREPWSERLDERFSWRLVKARDPIWHLLTAAQAQRECDVFLASNSYLTVMLNRIPTVAVVYDLITFDRRLAPKWRSTVIERLTLGFAVRRARGLVCISQATASELTQRYPDAGPHVTVAPLGVAPALNGAGSGELAALPSPGFVLAVGTLEPRKNLPRLVSAYARLEPSLQDAHPLVVVGARGWSAGPTLDALSALGQRCITLGHVSDVALAELYRRCVVFCYPSLGEGFGLPVLEAMAAGAPVLTSSLSSLPEVGGDAVAYVDPFRVQSIAGGLDSLLRDPERRSTLAQHGPERAREFSWSRFAEQVQAALERAAGAEPV